ncbi:MAG: glutamate racemase [bacterium]
MKIGIFDSGLGGLIIAKAIRAKMPQYDYVYLGDTKRVPYGNRSHKTVFEFTREGVEYLLQKENCAIVIVACNTASAQALRKIQQEYLPTHFPDRKVIGVLIPAAEEAARFSRIGVLATSGTVGSKTFVKEIQKINPRAKVFQNAAPMLVPLIEEGKIKEAAAFVKEYLKPLKGKKLDVLVLGCTHYPILKKEFNPVRGRGSLRALAASSGIKIISQDEVVPKKLRGYLARHPEISKKISKKGSANILVTGITEHVRQLSAKWFGAVKPRLVRI